MARLRLLPELVRLGRIACALLVGSIASGLVSAPVSAQSIVRGDIGGRVLDAGGLPVQEAEVSVVEARTGLTRWVETDRGGGFRLAALPAGEYSVRVEALGYRPVVYEGVPVRAGRSIEFRFRLDAVTPPVDAVQVVPFRDLAGTRLAPDGGRWFGETELLEIPQLASGLRSVAARSSAWDESGGTQGLPSSLARVYVDGIPVVPARHPYRPNDDFGRFALPGPAVGQMSLVEAPTDVEWSGGGGGQVAVGTHSSGGEPSVIASGHGSFGPLWGSRFFSGARPEALSYWGAVSADLPLSGDSVRLSMAGEFGSVRIPRWARLDPSALSTLETDPSAVGIQPAWAEDRDLYSGFLRLDWTVGSGTEVMARVGATRSTGSGGTFFSVPPASGGSAPHSETDISGALVLSTSLGSRFVLEVRTGLDRSVREFGTSAGGSAGASLPATYLASEGVWVGATPGSDGRILRQGFFGSSALHVALGQHRLKGGTDLTLSSHEYGVAPPTGATFFFSDADDLLARAGAYAGVTGGSALSTFSVLGLGGFLQYQWAPSAQVSITSGLRVDRESLPTDGVSRHAAWFALTGLSTADLPDVATTWGARLGATWDVTGGGSSVLSGSVGTSGGQVDPGLLHEAILMDGPVQVLRGVGALGAWPAAPASGVTGVARPILTIVSPAFRPPRTTRGTAAFSQSVGRGVMIRISGTMRRTEFLPRRTDLNRAVLPTSASNLGRDVYGDLVKTGTVIQAVPGSGRRFDEFDHVWGVSSTGSSDFFGVTVGSEYATDVLTLSADYTWSRTEDDWLGAAMGLPEAALAPSIAGAGSGDAPGSEWEWGRSDFDVPHRLVLDLSASSPLAGGVVTVGGTFRLQSGQPFTPSYGPAADVNGDGSGLNDPAFIPDEASIQGLLGEWPCLGVWIGQVVGRNACRGPVSLSLDARLALRLPTFGGVTADLLVEGFNLVDSESGWRDSALFLPDADSPITGAGPIAVPVLSNPRFGDLVHPTGLGRRVRVGVRVTTP